MRWWIVPVLFVAFALAGPLIGWFKIDTFGLMFITGGLALFFYPVSLGIYSKLLGVALVIAGVLLWFDVWSISGSGGIV